MSNTINENNLNDYSKFTKSNNYEIDEFQEFSDISADEFVEVRELQELQEKTRKTEQELGRMSQLMMKFKDKIPTAFIWNKLCSCVVSMEKFLKNEVNLYIDNMKNNVKTYVDNMKTDVKTYVDNMKLSIDTIFSYIRYIGEYDNDTQYYRFNQVKYQGNTYNCIKDCKGIPPLLTLDSSYWVKASQKGEKGERGDKGDRGTNLVPKGKWNLGVKYIKDDLVSHNDKAYFCIVPNESVEPPNPSYWLPFSVTEKSTSVVSKPIRGYFKTEFPVAQVPIPIKEYDIKTDVLEVFNTGALLTEGKQYKIDKDGIFIENILGVWDKNTEFDFKIIKNVIEELPTFSPSMLPPDGINETKLTQKLRDNILAVPSLVENINTNKTNIGVLRDETNKLNISLPELKKSLEDTNGNLTNLNSKFVTHKHDELYQVKGSYANSTHNHDLVTISANGYMSKEDKVKINGIETGANKYVHPSIHPASIITEDSSRRFVSDSEKTRFNNTYTKAETLDLLKSKSDSTHNHDFNNLINRPRFETEKLDIRNQDWVGSNNECYVTYEYLPDNFVRVSMKCTEIVLNANGTGTFYVPLKFYSMNWNETYCGGGQVYRVWEGNQWLSNTYKITSYNIACQLNGNNLVTIWVDEVNGLQEQIRWVGLHAYATLKLK